MSTEPATVEPDLTEAVANIDAVLGVLSWASHQRDPSAAAIDTFLDIRNAMQDDDG